MKYVICITLSEGTKEWPALEFLRMVEKASDDIPVPYREKAIAELEFGYGSSASLTIKYSRPMNDEEKKKVEAYDLKRKQDEEYYERLKRKFEK